LETHPSLTRTGHRKAQPPPLRAAGIKRRVTVCGRVDVLQRARVELARAAQDSAGFVRSLDLLEAHHQAVQREIDLVLDTGSSHTSQASLQALAQRRAWLHVIWLAKDAPHLNSKEREWRSLELRCAHTWLQPCASSSTPSSRVCATWGPLAPPSSMRWRSGSWTATASRPPVAHQDGRWAPETATSGHHIAANRT
jgi:hypothetical protein